MSPDHRTRLGDLGGPVAERASSGCEFYSAEEGPRGAAGELTCQLCHWVWEARAALWHEITVLSDFFFDFFVFFCFWGGSLSHANTHARTHAHTQTQITKRVFVVVFVCSLSVSLLSLIHI